MPDLEHDTTIALPRVTVLKASAGSGKTFRLTQRYAQFLLSEKIPRNGLRNLMALTFSNNAAREMRRKVLEWLKLLALGDHSRLAQMAEITSGGTERLARRAGELVDLVLSRYSEFQVRTIDSFMAALFRASALDFGFGPEIEISLDPEPLVDYAWSLFLREAREGSPAARLLDQTVASVLDFSTSAGGFDWNPAGALLEELRRLESRVSGMGEALVAEDPAAMLQGHRDRIERTWESLAELVERSGLDRHGNSRFPSLLASVRERRFSDLVAGSLRNPPVRKPPASARAAVQAYERIRSGWQEAVEAVHGFAAAWARAYYQPFLRLHAELSGFQDRVKKARATIFISDIGRQLAAYLTQDMVPDVYFRIGERVWHYLVDEFQDTSPLQWKTLFPLVENSLAMDGSLFVVGDTKQAIYSFRQADYTIMRGLETQSPFPSAPRDVRELGVNWRSRPRLVEFAQEVFRVRAAGSEAYREAARRSGLDQWHQEARPEQGRGYVEVRLLHRDDEEPPERAVLQEIVTALRARGWGWEDVALLAPKNADIVRATAWLNDLGVPVISFSSLDVRSRTVAGELLALLAFLDSPPDDLAFATFLLGTIAARAFAPGGGPGITEIHDFLFRCRGERPLYKAFQREFPAAWNQVFARLFRSAGYLPLYDLVSEACVRLDVFATLPQEEATFAKLLEVVKDFEGSGESSLREFLGAAGADHGADDTAKWAIDVPPGSPSVRAMTIHKAKGLGFPVVIVLLYGERGRGFPYAILREGADNSGRLVKVTKDLARHDEALDALYREETTRAEVDRLNRLYVALTRAETEMYVIGVQAEKEEFPFDLLPTEGWAPGANKESARPHKEEHREEREPEAPRSHEALPVRLTLESSYLSREERRRGELAHRILELLPGAAAAEAGLEAAAERAVAESRGDPAEAQRLLPALRRLLSQPLLADCFLPAADRAFLTECELCDSSGRLVRMDRVVVEPGRITVVDYKTGEEEPAAHEAQLRDYLGIASGAWPGRRARGVLAYVDLGSVRELA
ncbi:MAG TPA: UvrD-helicase domain-containing protein [Spirochaetia bacterium]|nr:UvrD-helicase domain-containing protein [Spirochaetia bacterium]